MPGLSSTTGLIAARVRPIYKPKPKKIELIGSTKPAPFTLRPFAGLFNPFPYGCSVLCNHPADGEAKEFVRRAKDSWANEGKALLLPAEMEMIRANLLAGTSEGITDVLNSGNVETTTTTVPEELFRKYTEMDSRPLTPAPTLASGPLTSHRHPNDEQLMTCHPRERTTLILDLRTNSQEQDIETLSWHALTLERQPTPRKGEISKPSTVLQQSRPVAPPPPSPALPLPIVELSDQASSRTDEQIDNSDSENELPMRRRGKRLRKRKCRRGSTYGQQTEVRDPPEPPETQVSQVDDASRRNSALPTTGEVPETKTTPPEKPTILAPERAMPESFISLEILKHLARELDRETIEEEFSLRRKIALEEAWRVRSEFHSSTYGFRQIPNVQTPLQNIPRLFSRQSTRFEILDSASLANLKPLEYLGKHVYITPGKKLIFGRAFNRYYDESIDDSRIIQPSDVDDGLSEILGKALSDVDKLRLVETVGPIVESLNFRIWCGLCAAVERLIAPLPDRDIDPPEWLERIDFEALERRISSIDIDPTLIRLLREIRDR